jgi:hypothetical protein
MPNQVRTAVLRLEGQNHGLLLDWTESIEQAFMAHHLGSTWKGFQDQLRPEALRSLAHCDDVLSRSFSEPVVEKDQLAEILSQVEALHAEMRTATLDAELKLFLLKHLREIQIAIESYQVLGAPGISRATNDAIGQLVVNRQQGIIARFMGSPLGQKTVKLLNRVALVAAFGANVARIEEGTERLTTWLLEAPEVVPDVQVVPDVPEEQMDPPKPTDPPQFLDRKV